YFLKIAQASNIEAQSHIYLARDLNYITNENLNTFINISGSVHRALDAFIYYLNKSS
ncbi:MAG: four helix bundle protein, partial [Candidatus Margulisbacteria bacterium]|nr:four helix bundle protein [Candidatus Margulisiibacteriota bacterium]